MARNGHGDKNPGKGLMCQLKELLFFHTLREQLNVYVLRHVLNRFL